jgi:hypothetical protein
MSGEVKRTRWSRTLFRAIVFAVIGISALILFYIAAFTYPPLNVYLGGSNELKNYYGKCMDIRRGQTEKKVRAIMGGYQIISQTPRALVFNTRTFSADLCAVRFFGRSRAPRDVG